jgi:hypothetical protein
MNPSFRIVRGSSVRSGCRGSRFRQMLASRRLAPIKEPTEATKMIDAR